MRNRRGRRNPAFEAIINYNWLRDFWPSMLPHATTDEKLELYSRVGRYWQEHGVPKETLRWAAHHRTQERHHA